MMTAHFWMGAGATLGVAAMMGLGLGSYVTSPHRPARSASDYVEATPADQVATEASFAIQKGPGVIHCTGCGPTLAERRWQADMAGLDANGMIDGTSDPVVRDYEAAALPQNLMPDAAPAAVRTLPPQIRRFAAGDAVPPPVAVPADQDAMEDDPPPAPVVATMPAEPRF